MPVPAVTVLMAVFNGQQSIRPTIESILNQTFSDFEFVIVNDASTDRTAEVINSYHDPKIILHHNAVNLGQTKSLNIGLGAARGKYIARTDAGDVSLPDRLKREYRFLEAHPDVAVVGTGAFRYNPEGRVIDAVHMPLSQAHILQRIFITTPVVHVSVLMKKETIRLFGGYDEKYHVLADYELWSRLIQNNHRIANLNDILSGYMISEESFGSKNTLIKSIVESPRIIHANVNRLTRLSISLQDALNIHKMFNHSMYDMSLGEIIHTEKVFSEIFQEIGASENDTAFYLSALYFKFILRSCADHKKRGITRHALNRLLSNSIRLNGFKRIYSGVVHRVLQSMIWKSKRIPVDLNFNTNIPQIKRISTN